MNEKSKKLGSIMEQNRVKLHFFEPSQREVWTIVGKEKEHWIDPDSNFCSCAGFYFEMLKNKKPCYHAGLDIQSAYFSAPRKCSDTYS